MRGNLLKKMLVWTNLSRSMNTAARSTPPMTGCAMRAKPYRCRRCRFSKYLQYPPYPSLRKIDRSLRQSADEEDQEATKTE